MLQTIKADLKQYYYDPNFRGMDVEARFKTADERLKAATSNAEIFGIIAQVLIEFDDSHTFFLAPNRVARVDYGWRMQMIGDQCYVVEVKPGSDAAAQGLKPGDAIYSVDGYGLTRENLWKFEYLYNRLKPHTGFTVVVQEPDGGQRTLNLAAKIDLYEELAKESQQEANRKREQEKVGTSVYYPRYHEFGPELIVCKMPRFNLTDKEVDEMMKKIASHKSLILDLRGNPGGNESTLLRLIGHFFDREVKIADLKERNKTTRLKAPSRGDKSFTGQVSILVDSESGSAAEMFARVMQLEKRGTVIGDRTSGSVMRAARFRHTYTRGVDFATKYSSYGASITIADSLMTDGQSLEHVGVTPDKLLLPSASDLVARRDPVLAHAAALAGVQLDPKKAGTLFPLAYETKVVTEEAKKQRP